jgi:hypothetical protein
MTVTANGSPEVLRPFAEAMVATSSSEPITTQGFVRCCDLLLPFFDHMGPVFSVARYEFSHKVESLRQATSSAATLDELVQADIK